MAEEAGGTRVPAKRTLNKNNGGTPKKQKTTENGKGKQAAKESEDEGGSEVDEDGVQELQSSDHAEQEEILNAPAEKENNPGTSSVLGFCAFLFAHYGQMHHRSRHPSDRCYSDVHDTDGSKVLQTCCR